MFNFLNGYFVFNCYFGVLLVVGSGVVDNYVVLFGIFFLECCWLDGFGVEFVSELDDF